MKTLLLHPIHHGFDGYADSGMTTWLIEPDHVPSLLRGEYRFLRKEGTSVRAARWHVWRMLSFLMNGLEWSARPKGEYEGHDFRLFVTQETEPDFSYLDDLDAEFMRDDLSAYYVMAQEAEPDGEYRYGTFDGVGDVHVPTALGDMCGVYESRAEVPAPIRYLWDEMLGRERPQDCKHEGQRYTRSDMPDVLHCSGCDLPLAP